MMDSQTLVRRLRILPVFLTLALIALSTLPTIASAQDATPSANSAVQAAADWLLSQQADDGGFLGFSGESDPAATVDVVIALAAARNAGIAIDLDDATDYLRQSALVYAQTGPGQAAKLVLALVALGEDPTDFENVNPLSIVEVSSRGDTGIIGFGPFDHAIGVLALVATGNDVPDSAIEAFRSTQTEEGSWSFDGTVGPGAGDTNTTAMAIQALVAAGAGDDPMVEDALDYLRSTQVENGAFPYQPGSAPNGDANSTALVVQAIIAAGQDPASGDWNDAASALATFQNPSGAFRFTDDQPDDNLFATLQALPALAGEVFPIIGTADVTATPIAA